jgi:hypothetical protein
MPTINARICLNDSLGSSSLSRSGRTVTRAMWRKVPAVNGKIHDVLASAIRPLTQFLKQHRRTITDRVGGPAEHDGRERADQASARRQDLADGGVPPVEPRLEQNGEVSDLVRDLVHQNGKSGQQTQPERHQEGAPQRQAVSEIIDDVGQQIQIAGYLQANRSDQASPPAPRRLTCFLFSSICFRFPLYPFTLLFSGADRCLSPSFSITVKDFSAMTKTISPDRMRRPVVVVGWPSAEQFHREGEPMIKKQSTR